MKIILAIIQFFRLSPNYSERVFGLDLMRALAIIFVVITHGSYILYNSTKFPWIPLINGVELFFVLSGFLIGGILLKTFEKQQIINIKTLWNFWIRRWFRTLPNYYLILLLNIVFVYYGFIKEDFNQFNWKFFLFLHNFNSHFHDFFWESWSLSIEEWFYLLFPVTLGLLFLVFKQLKISRKHIFLMAVIAFLFVSLILRVLIASKYEVDQFWLSAKISSVVIFHFDGIALGLLAAYVKYWYSEFFTKYRNIAFITGLVISYVVIFYDWVPNDFSTKVFKISLQSIGCFLLLPKFESIKKAPKIITKVVTHISLISYSMYLINLALIAEVIRDNVTQGSNTKIWFFYIVYWFCVIVFSTILYKYFEKPIMNLRDKWSKS